jgi:hypothetical protein
MDNQEMQFADPAWRPSQQPVGAKPDPREQDNLPPINDFSYAQPQEQIISPSQGEKINTGGPSYETGYRGYTGQQVGGTRFRPQQRRWRGPWAWLILAFLIIVLINGLSRAGSSIPSFGSPNIDFGNKGQFFDRHKPFRDSQTFSVGSHPTVNINDPVGTVTIQTDPNANANEVTIQTTRQFDGGSNDLNGPQISNGGNTITVNVNGNANSDFFSKGVDLVVTVPSGSDLNLTTSGDINVSGISGQMSLTTTGSGVITLSQASLNGDSSLTTVDGSINIQDTTLSGQTTLKSASGDVTFAGSLSPQGTYHFESNSGAVSVTLPGNSSFHTNASTNSGSISSDFPEVKTSNNSTVGSGDVGNPPYANLDIKTDSGSIDIHQG